VTSHVAALAGATAEKTRTLEAAATINLTTSFDILLT
jgi:hypothetical protein